MYPRCYNYQYVAICKDDRLNIDGSMYGFILLQMIEGCPPFHAMMEKDVPKAYVANERPQFKASSRVYAHGLKE